MRPKNLRAAPLKSPQSSPILCSLSPSTAKWRYPVPHHRISTQKPTNPNPTPQMPQATTHPAKKCTCHTPCNPHPCPISISLFPPSTKRGYPIPHHHTCILTVSMPCNPNTSEKIPNPPIRTNKSNEHRQAPPRQPYPHHTAKHQSLAPNKMPPAPWG